MILQKNYFEIDGLNEIVYSCLNEVMNAVNNTVINEYHMDDYPGAHGLTMYFPYWGGYQWFLPDDYYGNSGLDFTKDTSWDEFLLGYDSLHPRVDDDGDEDYIIIQESIDNSSKGDVIYVCNGTYHENIVINKSIILVGEIGSYTNIVGDKTGDVVTIIADEVKLLFFNISNSSNNGAGVITQTDYTEIRFCNIYNNNLGIYLNDSSNSNIIKNYIINNNYGIYLFSSNKNKILKNKFEDNEKHASFVNSFRNMWDNEYLNHPNKSVNIISGSISIGKISIPWINIDRHHIYII